MYKCIDCGYSTDSHRSHLNHLHRYKEKHWYQQEQEFYKERFDNFKLNAKFIKYDNKTSNYHYICNNSGDYVINNVTNSSKPLCKCKKCQWEHKSKASKNHWLTDGEAHAKAISKALLNNQHHREQSSIRFTNMYLQQNGHKPWSKYEQEISNYLKDKGIKHECNTVLLHLDGTTKNYIYDIYLPDYNLLIELNDRHFNDKLYTLEEAEDIPFKTYREEAIHDRLKYDLAISKGYKCEFFFNLDDCKKFIDNL